ncbi:MAG: glycosyltransferase family 2 protein [Candidatus Gottesmanbacteria bacterium]|nr:glycosyltransferase family 2 protein [Candidatus Gottesmanbacteria bacterium]
MKYIDLSLIIACYNEENLLRESVTRITSELDDSVFSYELIFVDDKSTDGTREIIASLVKKNKNFRALYHPVNQGRGKTVRDGIAIARGGVVGFIDIDLEVSSVYIPSFVRMILDGEADVVTGLRVYREGLSSIHRSILSRGYSWLVRSVLGIPLQDTETGYKFFNRKKILPILNKTKHNGWFWDTEIMTYAYYAGLVIREAPVLFIRRFDKKSSVRLVHDTYEYIKNLLGFHKQLVKQGYLLP